MEGSNTKLANLHFRPFGPSIAMLFPSNERLLEPVQMSFALKRPSSRLVVSSFQIAFFPFSLLNLVSAAFADTPNSTSISAG